MNATPARQTRTFTARNGTTVESHLTTPQATEICKSRYDSFSTDLARKAARYTPTDQQEAWLHIKAIQWLDGAKSEQNRLATAKVLNVVGIIRLLEKAKDSGLKLPGIRIALDRQRSIKLTVAGGRARIPGSINILRGRDWFGRIRLDGTLDLKSTTPDWVTQLLVEFAADPITVARRYGRLTDSCSFCGKDLSDDRSTKVGYGPTCASRYQLPWGDGKTEMPDDAPESKRDRDVRYATGR